MPLVTTKQMLLDAQKGGYAVEAFNVENMEMVQAVIAAAEELKSPVIMQTTPGTLKYADADYFYANVKTAAQKASVPVVMHLLLELGYIEERYIDAMIQNIEENGPYVVLTKGFAVPHEGLDQGSIKVGMNLIRLKNPVNFDAEENDPVEFVCCLSAVDHKTHLKAFFNLVNMLQNPEFKEALRQCKTPDETAKVIEKYEYSIDS